MSKSILVEKITDKIYLIRGQKVMFDFDLSGLYRVRVSTLNQAVKRNPDRFPSDFIFQITKEELENLIFQFGISNLKSQVVISSWGGRRTLPFAFSEQGIAMLSSVLKSKRAIKVNIAIMRAFVKLRRAISAHRELTRKFKELESRVDKHDSEIMAIFEAIRKMIEPPVEPKRRIGFLA
jgi:hypothetical protein